MLYTVKRYSTHFLSIILRKPYLSGAFILAILFSLFLLIPLLQQQQDNRQQAASLTGIPAQGFSRFEPPNGKAFYGMGQGFNNPADPNGNVDPYTRDTQPGICSVFSKNGVRPRLLSGYIGMRTALGLSNAINLFETMNSKEGNYYIPMISIVTAVQDITYVDNILNGVYDQNLKDYGAQATRYGKPIFIRPSYEINDGGGHDNMMKLWAAARGKTEQQRKDTTLLVYRKVVDLMRQGSIEQTGKDLLNVAWVWHVWPNSGGNSYWDSWYPGNRYVDWMGISIYGNDYVKWGFDSIAAYSKYKGNMPIVLSESAPISGTGTVDPNVLTGFFDPYFSHIENSNYNVKGFIYLNNLWSADPVNAYLKWPDTRIQSNPSVVNRFVTETAKPYFQVPSTVLQIGQKPYEGPGISAGWQSSDGVLHIISRDKYWELNQPAGNVWTVASPVASVAPFTNFPDAARINGLAPWESGGITAAWFTPSESNRYLRIIGGGNRFYRYDYQTATWWTGGNPWNIATNTWSQAPTVNGLKPWDGGGITAAWVAPDNYMRVISKDRFYRQNLTTGLWDTASTALGVLPLGNATWSAAPLVDGLKPWQGAGITAAWVKDGHILQLKNKDRYWEWDLTAAGGLEWGIHGNYRDGDNANVWKKAPFIEIAGAPQPSTNQSAVCPLPNPTPRPVTPTLIPTKTPTPRPTNTPTPRPTSTPTRIPTATLTKVPTVTPTRIPTATPTKVPPTGIGSPPTVTPTIRPTVTPTRIPTQSVPTASPTSKVTVVPTQTPTPTTQLGKTTLSLTLGLHGIGTGGDNVNPTGTGNTNPLHSTRSVLVDVYNVSNVLVVTTQGAVTYSATSGRFVGSANVDQLSQGLYTGRVRINQYLTRTIPGIITIQPGQTTIIPLLSITTGDIDTNNKLNINDYNMILDCFSELLPPRNCSDATKKVATDLNDDGNINQFDYNLFLRELSVQSGQ